MTEPQFLIWSEEHRAWWGPSRWGYTEVMTHAGRYSQQAAEQIVREANFGSAFNEIAIPVPAGLDALIQRAAGQGNDDAS